ncbi:MAG: response regulator transcription factor [Crocinitomicaceae bacterium]
MENLNGEKSILLIDDEPDILEILSYSLKKEGYKVFKANNGLEGTQLAKDLSPDLIILDVMMPQMDGIEACQIIRNDLQLKQPIIAFLTSRSEDYSQIAGLDAGADDYITKPIRPRLFVSKVESLLRRGKEEPVASTASKELKINREKFLITFRGQDIVLPKKEFELLELLASRPGKVFHRNQILNIVWGDGAIVGERTIDVHIRKLREKLGNTYIRTIKGVGYTFTEF